MNRWAELLSTVRLRAGDEPAPGDEGNHFLSDYYRVVFASSFRRLQDKTQVKPLAQTDYVRKRLTHSFEVAVIGERMGRVVAHRLSDRIGVADSRDAIGKVVATACLLHDIGNPPFGHEGELAIRAWADTRAPHSADYRCFDGNAQGFRIAVRLQHLGKQCGMNLTAATLATMLKYPAVATLDTIPASAKVRERGKWSVLSSERKHYENVTHLVALPQGCRHPLSYLVEAADDIVNRLVDVEDAIKLKLITYAEVCDVLRAVDEPVAKELLEKTEVHREAIKTGTAAEQQLWAYQNFRVRATTKLAQACEVVFCDAVEQLETGGFEGDLISNCEHAALYEAIKKLEYEKIFGDAEIVRIEAGGKKAIGGLLEMFAEELSNKSKLSKTMPMPMTSDMDTENDSHASIARVVDYVAGMTDRYAIDLYQELSGVSL